jgi:hypothetical protein
MLFAQGIEGATQPERWCRHARREQQARNRRSARLQGFRQYLWCWHPEQERAAIIEL